jgi:hypothetical protein
MNLCLLNRRTVETAAKLSKRKELDSVEVVKWRVPIDGYGFFAFWVSANKILFDCFTIKTASQRFFKGISGMNFIWRRSCKNPVTIWTFEGEFGCSHDAPSNYYYATS